MCRCKFEHPWDKLPVVRFNSMGLPLRQGQPLAPCSSLTLALLLAAHCFGLVTTKVRGR